MTADFCSLYIWINDLGWSCARFQTRNAFQKFVYFAFTRPIKYLVEIHWWSIPQNLFVRVGREACSWHSLRFLPFNTICTSGKKLGPCCDTWCFRMVLDWWQTAASSECFCGETQFLASFVSVALVLLCDGVHPARLCTEFWACCCVCHYSIIHSDAATLIPFVSLFPAPSRLKQQGFCFYFSNIYLIEGSSDRAGETE